MTSETISLDTLHALLAERKKDLRDVTMPFGKVQFVATRAVGAEDDGSEPETRLGVQLDDGRVYNFNKVGAGQVCSKLGVPANYLAKLPVDLALANVTYWQKQRAEDNVFWRLNDKTNTVRAALSTRFADVPHEDVLSTLLSHPALRDKIDVVRSFDLTDQQMVIRLTARDRLPVDPVIPNDGYFAGIVVRNSDVGLKPLEVGAFLYVLVCTNGLIAARAVATFHRKHVGTIDIRAAVADGVTRAVASPYPAAVASLAPFSKTPLPMLAGETDGEVLSTMLVGTGLGTRLVKQIVNRIGDNPLSGWNIVQAMTSESQKLDKDARQDVDDAAGKLAMVFLRKYSDKAATRILGEAGTEANG